MCCRLLPLGRVENKLRIIGGCWRSRRLGFHAVEGLRPTPARVRETVFNWLQYDIEGSRCLDLYAGSGALGFEAASRGAKTVVQVENNPLACEALRVNIRLLDAQQVTVHTKDARAYLAGRGEPFDIVFLDPPFRQDMAYGVCQYLDEQGWLSPYAKIYLETEPEFDLAGLPASWQVIKQKKTGAVAYRLFVK